VTALRALGAPPSREAQLAKTRVCCHRWIDAIAISERGRCDACSPRPATTARFSARKTRPSRPPSRTPSATTAICTTRNRRVLGLGEADGAWLPKARRRAAQDTQRSPAPRWQAAHVQVEAAAPRRHRERAAPQDRHAAGHRGCHPPAVPRSGRPRRQRLHTTTCDEPDRSSSGATRNRRTPCVSSSV
jgi:hypothetical protein